MSEENKPTSEPVEKIVKPKKQKKAGIDSTANVSKPVESAETSTNLVLTSTNQQPETEKPVDSPVPEKAVKKNSFFINTVKPMDVPIDVFFNSDEEIVAAYPYTSEVLRSTAVDLYQRKFAALGTPSDITCKTITFKFIIPNYSRLNYIREMATVVHNNRPIINETKIREGYLAWCLKDVEGIDGVEMTHDEDGSLSDESINDILTIHPSILEQALARFEILAALKSQ